MTKINLPENFLLINKPVGWTSFDVVNFIRRNLRNSGSPKNIKVGHAGTLDPFATGLLIVGVGREATKRLDEFKNLPKTYIANLQLGETSNTGDITGQIKPYQRKFLGIKLKSKKPDKEKIQKVLQKFIGKQLQTPPMFSAKKIKGKKLYELARKGKTIKRQPSEIEIYNIELLDYNWPNLKIKVDCGAGTYVRTLGEDIGTKLGCGAYCKKLNRTKIGDYNLEDAKEVKK